VRCGVVCSKHDRGELRAQSAHPPPPILLPSSPCGHPAQYNGDGIAARGVAYGMHTIRVDGNDVWAVLAASRRARDIASGADGSGQTKPVLIEAMTYREGHHSTSDDSTRYRTPDEIKTWREVSNPVRRLRRYLERRGWWNEEKESALIATERQAVLQAMTVAERKEKPDVKVRLLGVWGCGEGMAALR